MEQHVFAHTSHPEQVLALLTSHLPYSLPLLRRLQFMNLPGGRSATSNVLASFDSSIENGKDKDEMRSFTVAYLDLSLGPETEMWIYSSMEHPDCSGSEAVKEAEQVLAMMRHVSGLAVEWEKTVKRNTPGVVLVGTMHEKVLSVVQGKGVVKRASEPHFKFVFRKENFPVQKLLMEGFEWGVVREDDLGLVLSRTEIPRKPKTMILMPSAAIRIAGSGEVIAWAFLGLDGSLTTLHCEEAYRGRGFAKALGLKLFYERLQMYGAEGFAHADVLMENVASEGVCRSLRGTVEWHDYWHA